jgi:hypothetical protein
MRQIVVSSMVLVLLGGCAQNQVNHVNAGMAQAHADQQACVTAVISKPEYAALLPHNSASMAELTNDTYPTPDEAHLLSQRFDEAMPCSNRYIAAVGQVRPDLVPILMASRTASANRVAMLVEHRLTWAQAAHDYQEAHQRYVEADAAATRELNEQLAEQRSNNAAVAAAILMSRPQTPIPTYVPPSAPASHQTNCTTSFIGGFANTTCY